MRRLIVTLLALAMLIALGVVTAKRLRHLAPAGASAAEPQVAPPALVEPVSEAAPVPVETTPPAPSRPPSVPPRAALPPLERPLRVRASSWEALAPALLSIPSALAQADAGIVSPDQRLELEVVADPEALMRTLAWGGDNPSGADVVLAPLPAAIAILDRLAPLEPVLVYVVAWLRHGAACVGPAGPLAFPPDAGPVTLAGTANTPATFLSLFALDLSGLPPARVQLVDPSHEVVFEALGGPAPRLAGRAPLLRLDTASKLIPLVAVTSRAFLEAHQDALVDWLGRSEAGLRELGRDLPGSARRMAAYPGAPEPADLLPALSTLAPVSLRDNARLAGLSGRTALTVQALARRTWSVLHEAELVPSPPAASFDTGLITAAIRARVPLDLGAAPQPQTERHCRQPASDSPIAFSFVPREGLTDAQLVEQLAFTAELFAGNTLRLRAPDRGEWVASVAARVLARTDAQDVCVVAAGTPAEHPAALRIEVIPPR